jgi:hypothetical protein
MNTSTGEATQHIPAPEPTPAELELEKARGAVSTMFGLRIACLGFGIFGLALGLLNYINGDLQIAWVATIIGAALFGSWMPFYFCEQLAHIRAALWDPNRPK